MIVPKKQQQQHYTSVYRSGDTKYKVADAQQLYRQLSRCYEKIDSTSFVLDDLVIISIE